MIPLIETAEKTNIIYSDTKESSSCLGLEVETLSGKELMETSGE